MKTELNYIPSYRGLETIDHIRGLRHNSILYKPAYRIRGMVDGENADLGWTILQRRLRKGQCYYLPYLGVREFYANFREGTDRDVTCPDNKEEESYYCVERWENGRPLFVHVELKKGVVSVR